MKLISRVQLLATPWTAAYQAPPPMGFSRQEYWNGMPLPSPYFSLNNIKSTGDIGFVNNAESGTGCHFKCLRVNRVRIPICHQGKHPEDAALAMVSTSHCRGSPAHCHRCQGGHWQRLWPKQ